MSQKASSPTTTVNVLRPDYREQYPGNLGELLHLATELPDMSFYGGVSTGRYAYEPKAVYPILIVRDFPQSTEGASQPMQLIAQGIEDYNKIETEPNAGIDVPRFMNGPTPSGIVEIGNVSLLEKNDIVISPNDDFQLVSNETLRETRPLPHTIVIPNMSSTRFHISRKGRRNIDETDYAAFMAINLDGRLILCGITTGEVWGYSDLELDLEEMASRFTTAQNSHSRNVKNLARDITHHSVSHYGPKDLVSA
jgi:hypothetical protein